MTSRDTNALLRAVRHAADRDLPLSTSQQYRISDGHDREPLLQVPGSPPAWYVH
jgi:hypothetical protein